jgi:hypothetical protein
MTAIGKDAPHSGRVPAGLSPSGFDPARWNPVLEDGSCDHEWSRGDAWPVCVHCEQPAPDDYDAWFAQ